MLKQTVAALSGEMRQVLRTSMIALQSYLINVPLKKHDATFVIKQKKEWDGSICEQGLPVPPEELLQKYSESHFLDSGKRDVATMLEILKNADFECKDGHRILDFGCASGRMTRWLYPYSKNSDIWGVDINANNIIWCQQYLSSHFKFSNTTRLPHLPFEDNHFNLIYAGSVFTHLDNLADTWLLELRRILKPKGKLYITIADNHSIQHLNKPENENSLFKNFLHSDDQLLKSFKEYVKQPFDFFSILRSHAPHTFLETSPNVFYDIDYFTEFVSSFYKVISVHPGAYSSQTGILLEKR